MATSPIVLEAKNIRKTYGGVSGTIQSILDDVSFAVSKGEIVSFMGPSGSGKTTLLQICGLLDRANSGDIEINGISTCQLDEKKTTKIRKDNMGFVYQMHYLSPEFSATENVELPLLIDGVSKRVAVARVAEMLDRLGIFEKRFSMPAELSGGERQRVAIARALITCPAIVLADEPTGNLDSENSEMVLNLLVNMVKTMNTSMLMVTHNMELAKKTDRIIFIKNHKIVQET
ncbi:lipoprotein-releasing system ATP-binding protein LolD 1 [Bacilli bacterium]|nr:lipoprotein-releasing system ATP-binding protein LolD 1 [Bacilli bacterium]